MPLIALDWLQNWYRSQCNGKWERVHGVTIETLDCPGWLVTIDLGGTKLENAVMEEIRVERSKTDWVHCAVEYGKFYGQGDVNKLGCILLAFQHWVKKQSEHLVPGALGVWERDQRPVLHESTGRRQSGSRRRKQ